MNQFRILADNPDGATLECFVWNRSAVSGIEHAEREAQESGRADLLNFRAVPTGEMIRAMFTKYDLIRLQNHAANVSQDHLTFAGFFTKESEFAALADTLAARIAARKVIGAPLRP